ncbi:MAG: hypothetical protein FWD57_15795, partial [Polyangiaceae bacterium]|nr:hypothetical protein [Polyangiaceae bacterium]
VSIAGLYDIKWEGPIPYVPQVNFHLLGMKQFDAWAFPPDSATVSAFTAQFTLFKINVLALAKIPKEVAEGGITLDLRGELKATYHTEKMVIQPAKNAITTDDGAALHNFVGGPYVEVDVYPDGRMAYDGVVHLIPTFYIKVLNGKEYKFPAYDFPVNITSLIGLNLGGKIAFDKVRIHVPLPDILPFEEGAVVDFGDVPVGSGDKFAVELTNVGEAKARAVGEVEPAMASVFKMLSPATLIEPGETEEMTIRFAPSKAGAYETKLTVRSNDPDLPEQTITLRGVAYDPEDPETWPEGGIRDSGSNPGTDGPNKRPEQDMGEDGGCACHIGSAASSTPSRATWLGLLGLAALWTAGRGSAKRRSPSVPSTKRI